MMSADVLKKATDAQNDCLVAPSLDRVLVTDKAHTVLVVGDEVYTTANGRKRGSIGVPNTLKGMVEGADFTGGVGWTKSPDPVRIGPVGDDWSTERSRDRTTSGEESGV